MAACRLAAKGRSLADSSYEAEVRSISEFLQLQRPAAAPAISADSLNINPEDYAPPRFARKLRGKVGQSTNHTLEAITLWWRLFIAYKNFTWVIGRCYDQA